MDLQDRVTLTGYLDTDESLTDHLAACDVTLNLRWPTARETSGPWLRALAAGKPTIVTDLVHLADVPSLDPRTWTVQEVGGWGSGIGKGHEGSNLRRQRPSAVPDPQSPVPEPRLRRHRHPRRGSLAAPRDAAAGGGRALRERLGDAARDWWTREHSIEAMVDDYERVMRDAAARPDPRVDLPRAPA